MNFINLLKQKFREGDALIRLIFINVAVFVVLQSVKVFLLLFNIHTDVFFNALAAPAHLGQLMFKPWTILTYMFMHEGLMHLFFNMFAFYWFGKLFLLYFSPKQLVGLFLIGGFGGFLSFSLAYNIFPYFNDLVANSSLVGASGSITAIILAVATKAPNMEMRLLLFGNIKLKYIALITVFTSFFGIASSNAGGEIAHLGGALIGYLFIVSLQQGKDITAWINKLLDGLYDLFRPRKLKVRQSNQHGKHKMSDGEFNQQKAQRMTQIDAILDKIKSSGYESLTEQEKRRLFEQGKN
ncbi:MAG: hypothetical protein AUK44_04685 [Porphyromonadaceae bacterium CG2_30_38_12]|nr:MAG: hypothetical protein AUK44_04685 [Porphyromonadaceae bacterium CG2_30_38_12]